MLGKKKIVQAKEIEIDELNTEIELLNEEINELEAENNLKDEQISNNEDKIKLMESEIEKLKNYTTDQVEDLREEANVSES